MASNDQKAQKKDEGSKSEEKKKEEKEKELESNKLIGPGLGLIILGVVYFVWYIMPFSFEYLNEKPLAIHNWGYSMIFLTAGLGWYQKSIVARVIVFFQTSLLPFLASGSFNPLVIVILTFIILGLFLIIVLIERKRGDPFFKERLKVRTWNFLNMHLLIVSWILIMHIGFVFLVQRAPQEIDLLWIGPNAGWLQYYTAEIHEISTWTFDIAIILWGITVLYEQFTLGYNFKNNPWPRWSFYMIFIAIGVGLLGLLIQQLTYGFEIENILDLIDLNDALIFKFKKIAGF
ncbi:MAG: membrane protein of unknown function [Promethearchaeota archaeon]|nr:MAG: membrane protein of unknown function [Candidatus Lokiarchaeota archaeon]